MADSGSVKRREIRCAIYTRKSSEEGLEQDFNSLDAQREACEAYIRSQKHEGWSLVETAYDDGGYSGGTMDRPALRKLLADIGSGRVSVVVVYKVDRLTRSLADFSKMVEVFDRQGASFVSVTQQFNTTTSMGRLTLNVLLSFAQFEREVTGERIRDKIAASKKKGMWMGGPLPLGYDVKERHLIVNQAEAETVRMIFRRYASLGSVRALKQELDREGIVSKVRITPDGRRTGGVPIAAGALYLMLKNRIYIGQIVHKGKSFPGEHSAIVDQSLWDSVQAKLEGNRVDRATGARAQSPSLLGGIIYDAAGQRMTPSHAVKGRTRYRYYVSQPLTRASQTNMDGQRIPAAELESKVSDRILAWLKDQPSILNSIKVETKGAAGQRSILEQAAQLADQWPGLPPAQMKGILLQLVDAVVVVEDRLEIRIWPNRLALVLEGRPAARSTDRDEATLTLECAMRLQRCGFGIRMVVEGERARNAPDPRLVNLIVRAQALREKLLSGRYETIDVIAQEEGLTPSYTTRLLRLGFLAPDVTKAILDGSQPVTLTAQVLLKDSRLPLDWAGQKRRVGFKNF